MYNDQENNELNSTLENGYRPTDSPETDSPAPPAAKTIESPYGTYFVIEPEEQPSVTPSAQPESYETEVTSRGELPVEQHATEEQRFQSVSATLGEFGRHRQYEEQRLYENHLVQEIEQDNRQLKAVNLRWRVATIVLSVLLLLSVGYLVLSEVSEPLFGKWPRIARQNEELLLQAEILNQLRAQNDSLTSTNNLLLENAVPVDQSGIYFEVQIGAFENFNLESYLQDLARLRKEQYDGMDKYTLGRFRDYRKAVQFKADIQRMGIADAFLVAKKDGQRVADIQTAVAESRKR